MWSTNIVLSVLLPLTNALLVANLSSADNLCKQFESRSGPTFDILSGLIWIKTAWHSDSVHERIFQKKIILKKGLWLSADDKGWKITQHAFHTSCLVSVICTLEASGKWPDNVEAIRRLKAAFHIKLSEALKSQFKLPVRAGTTFVDVLKVCISPFVF